MTDLLKVKGLDRSHMLGKTSWLLLMPSSGDHSGSVGILSAIAHTKYTPTYTGAPPSGFSSQLSHSAGSDMKVDQSQLGFGPGDDSVD